tara:strand:+ start:78 stop:224 length:147 start_codon:yes stop_codon:yes gene_type:complete
MDLSKPSFDFRVAFRDSFLLALSLITYYYFRRRRRRRRRKRRREDAFL